MLLNVILGLILLAEAVAYGILAALHIRHRIGPNRIIGIRVKKTLSDPAVWYEVHEHLGRGLVLASGAMALGAAATLVFCNVWPNNLAAALLFVLSTVPPVGAVFYGLWHLRNL